MFSKVLYYLGKVILENSEVNRSQAILNRQGNLEVKYND